MELNGLKLHLRISLSHLGIGDHQEDLQCWVPVSHTCNPSYSGGRDKENLGPKTAQQIVRETVSRKKPIPKRDGGVA
jgi:hypothetical protein